MTRLFLRLLGNVFLILAIILAVLDIARSLSLSAMIVTSLGDSWIEYSPDSLLFMQNFIGERISQTLWNPVMTTFLQLPGWLVFCLFWLLLASIAQKPRASL